MSIPTPASILKDIFGYDTFRPYQKEVIENILARRDTLAIMPTGGGKSLCYQIPALIFDGLTVVVSPLIALMKDQVEQLRANGVPSLFLNSTLSPQAYQENMDYIRRGEVKLLYVAPETLLTARIFSLLDSVKVDLLTIDEAHCISEWGHDFRPEYRQLVGVRRRYPKAVCLAMTATATPRVCTDIKTTLGFAQSNLFLASFNRENLYIEVAPKSDPMQQTVRFLDRYKDQSGIIYCFSRKQVDELAQSLAQKGYSVRPYHAGLEDSERKANQEAFIRDDAQIIVATIAFGMGINKPNVRFVLHYDLPKSIEGYYQEIGRAGRDGLPAHCLLLYSYADAAKQRYFIDQKEGEERQVASQHLDAIVRYAEDDATCRRKTLLGYFGEIYPTPPSATSIQQKSGPAPKCGNCDNCKSAPPVFADITIPAQKFLSCVKRTGERFGAGHVIDVLRGSKNEKVLRNEHDKLSTYGIGTDLSEKQWSNLSRQLIQMGYLSQTGEFLTLSLTDKAMEALRKRSPILGHAMPEVNEKAEERPRREKTATAELEYNSALYALLRQKRKDLADQAGLPPYVIFSDKSLVEMAAYYPQSLERLLDINGVGQVKLHQYGELFLEIIKPFCKKHRLAEKVKGDRENKKPASDKSDAGRRYVKVSEAYNAGASIASLMKRYKVEASTILDHLARYAAAGNKLRRSDDLKALVSASPDEQQAVFKAFDAVGTAALRPVFEMLGGKIDYDELKVLKLVYLTERD
ncbi:MAG: DNA helicase RecQ [Anaerolineaceae bacterium]|nr:DNA helicase RecQ [Anaerolineaceae bacterium]